MAKETYYFKHENYGKEWQEWRDGKFDEEYVAQQIAEENFHDDPCNPSSFEFEVEVKKGENGIPMKFLVTAEADVSFYSREVKSDESNQELK